MQNVKIAYQLLYVNLLTQVLAGALFLVIGAININKVHLQIYAIVLNNIITILLTVVALDNIVLNAFGLEHDPHYAMRTVTSNKTR